MNKNNTTQIQFGTALRSPFDVARSAAQIENLGFDVLGCGEHVSFYGDTANAFISLSVAAGVTSRIRLMSTITLVPLYPPPLLAKQVTTLDHVSNGRFELGIGVGGEYAKEFEASNVPVGERGARTNEALQIMHQLWADDKVTFDGRFNTLPGVTLDPKPVQSPHPPIWVSGRSDAAMRRCARYGTGWLPYMYTPEMLGESMAKINAYADEYQRAHPEPGLFIFFAVHEDREVAIKMASERLSKQYNQDFSKLVHRYALAGNPDDLKARLGEYINMGATTVMLNSACPAGYVDENERLFAQAVLPQFR